MGPFSTRTLFTPAANIDARLSLNESTLDHIDQFFQLAVLRIAEIANEHRLLGSPKVAKCSLNAVRACSDLFNKFEQSLGSLSLTLITDIDHYCSGEDKSLKSRCET